MRSDDEGLEISWKFQERFINLGTKPAKGICLLGEQMRGQYKPSREMTGGGRLGQPNHFPTESEHGDPVQK